MGRDEAAPNKVTSASSIASTVQSIENTLDMLTNENLILERDTDLVERLRKEKVWLEVEVKTKHTNSLVNAVTRAKWSRSCYHSKEMCPVTMQHPPCFGYSK